MADVSFGEWLKRRRKAQGLTQVQLASQVSCSVSALRKIEVGERRASVQLVELFAKVFNIPSSERKAFLRFARGGGGSAPNKTTEDTLWLNSAKPPRLNLPATITSIIGREKETGFVRDYLLDPNIRLVTLIGPPGIGKTRLSLEVSRASLSGFPDGIFFVALASLDDPSLVITTIIQSLEYIEARGENLIKHLTDGIGDKHMILVLDNCEHLIEELAPLVSRLLSACSRLKILATSRESLRIPGEWLYSVPTLDIPKEYSLDNPELASQYPALTLFVERARAVRSDFVLDASNLQAVISICKELDGLPLAIELIATRIRLMLPHELLERLNDQFILSANGMRAVTVRQKTLNNAIGWSYNSLPPEEQRLFVNLSIFSGSFTLQSAGSIFSVLVTKKSISDLITSLSDKSLVQRTLDARGETRFTMLVTIQKFALDQLRQGGGENEARNRHLAYFLELAEQADKEAHGPNQLEWTDRLNTELENFRAALNWCLSSGQTEGCLQLFSALAWTWNVRWSQSEARSWFYKIRALPDVDKHPENFGRILNSAGLREWRLGNYGEARSILEESLAIWISLGAAGELGRAAALVTLGMVARWGEEDINKAEPYFKQSLELFQKCEDEWGVAWNLFHLGIAASDRDQDELAYSFLEQSLGLYNELGDLWGVGRVTQFLGMIYLKQGNYSQAHFYFDQHLRNDERLCFMDGISVAFSNFGELYRLQGDYDLAEKYYEKSLTISREYGMKLDFGINLYNLGLLALHRNDYPRALQHFIDFFESARTINEKTSARDLFIGLAAIAAGTDQPERAAKLFGAAQFIFDTTDNLFSQFDRAEIDRYLQVAQNQLGELVFESLAIEGRKMTIDQAVAYALSTSLDKV